MGATEPRDSGDHKPERCRGAELAREQRPDLIILDIMMPNLDGIEVLRRLRERSWVPVLLLTARTRDHDKIGGLDFGADDYVTKPFNPEELTSRVKAILRRGQREELSDNTVVQNGDVKIDLGRRRVYRGGEDVVLSRTEWVLLEQLAIHAGKLLTVEDLLKRLWSLEHLTDAQYLRVWVSRLRTKLGDKRPFRLIKTVTGVGYMLTPDNGTNGEHFDITLAREAGITQEGDASREATVGEEAGAGLR